jgi:hypothetical protein
MSTSHAGAGPRSLAVHGRGAGGPRGGAKQGFRNGLSEAAIHRSLDLSM